MTTIIQLLKSCTVLFAILLVVLSVAQGYVGLLPIPPVNQMYIGLCISVVITVLRIVIFIKRSSRGSNVKTRA